MPNTLFHFFVFECKISHFVVNVQTLNSLNSVLNVELELILRIVGQKKE